MCDCLLTKERLRADQVPAQSGMGFFYTGAAKKDGSWNIEKKYSVLVESEKQADKAAEKKKETFSAAKETTRMIEDDVKVKTAGKVCGYAVQLGCYSDQASAEKAREAVGLEGLQIVEQRNMYKVIGKICKSKEDARSQMAELPEGTKGFVTEVYE